MRDRLTLLVLLGAAGLAAGCMQKLDKKASSSSTTGPGFGSVPADPGGGIPTILDPNYPLRYGDNGTATGDPCVATAAQSMDIRQRYCGACHGPNGTQGQPLFNFVLDDAKLTSTVDMTSKMLFVAPGDPDHSRVYQRVVLGTMPPIQVSVDQPDYPRPTVSDISVIYQWVMCLGRRALPPLSDQPDGGIASGPEAGTAPPVPGPEAGAPPALDSGRPPAADAGLMGDAEPPDDAPWYRIVNKATGLCIDSGGLTAADADLLEQPCQGTPTQQWQSLAGAGGVVHLVNRASRLCADNRDARLAGSTVGQLACDSRRFSIDWAVSPLTGTAVHIAGRSNGLCLGGSQPGSGGAIRQSSCAAGDDQIWTLDPIR
jgi:hypothetical protein